MMNQHLHDSLAEVEQLLGTTGELLLRGDALALERQAATLRQAVAVFAQASRAAPREPALQARMADMALQFRRQRETLARRSAMAERAVAAVLPRTGDPTYAAPASAGGFKGSVARIYAGAAP